MYTFKVVYYTGTEKHERMVQACKESDAVKLVASQLGVKPHELQRDILDILRIVKK